MNPKLTASDRVMALNKSNNPDYWQNPFEEARAIAVQMVDSQTKATMLAIARDYEKLAKRGPNNVEVSPRLGSDPQAASRSPASSPSADGRRGEFGRLKGTNRHGITLSRSDDEPQHPRLQPPCGSSRSPRVRHTGAFLIRPLSQPY